MTDEELSARVAEIEGWGLTDGGRTAYGWHWARCVDTPTGKMMEHFHGESPPPYATDWQWCGPLIEKCRMVVSFSGTEWGAGFWDERNAQHVKGEAKTPQPAVCLAIIAAHEDKPSGVWTGLGDK